MIVIENYKLTALNKESGDLLWNYISSDNLWFSMFADENKTRLYLTDNNKIVELNIPDLDDDAMNALKRKAGSLYTFMMNPERLESIAADIAKHYTGHVEPNGYKAQAVCFTREACVIIKEHLDNL